MTTTNAVELAIDAAIKWGEHEALVAPDLLREWVNTGKANQTPWWRYCFNWGGREIFCNSDNMQHLIQHSVVPTNEDGDVRLCMLPPHHKGDHCREYPTEEDIDGCENLEDMMNLISGWARFTFKEDAHISGFIPKLLEEVQELNDTDDEEERIREFADSMIAALAIAFLMDIVAVKQAIKRKMKINTKRTWVRIPGTDTYRHVGKGEEGDVV